MRSIVRGVVALIAAFCMMDVAKAAPTIVSPADYATVKTMTDAMHDFLYSDAMLDPDTFTYTQTEYIAEDNEYRYVVTDARKAYMAEYNSNTIPVVFKWSAATDHSGDYTVTVKRVKDGKTVFTQTTTSTTVTFYDPEVGRNYIWTVTDNTGSATGHFYTDRRGPRIIYSETSHLTNARDLGGWTTTDGKVVKQGLIYRAPEWEWSARQKTETGNYFEMPYLRDVLGIKLEVDLRGRDSNTGGSSVTGQTYIDYFECGSVYESTIDSSIPRFFCEHAGSTVAFPGYEGFNSSAANRIAVWHTFTNFCDVVKADGTTKPVIFHCSHGKDRTGSLAYVLLGVLGVPRDSLERDWALSWYSEGKYDVCMNKKAASKTPDTTNEWALDKLITAIDNNYSGATLKERCYNYLLTCAKNASVSEVNAKALIDNYISIMLEEPETAAVNPDPNAPQPPEVEEPEVEVDEFVYTDYYFRGFGSFNEHYRWFKSLNDSSVCADGFSPISYKNRFYFQPTASTHHALGLYSRNATEDMAMKTGMIVCDASKQGSDGQVGIYDCAFYFSSEGHTVSERCIFEHRAGRSEWIGTHLYFVDPYNTSKSVYDGLASIDVWGGSTMCISGFISKSPNKTYLKFPADNCNNARVEVFYDDKENYSTLGWFTGGSESTKQYFQVTNAFMQFTTSGKVNGVAGALGLEFGLGELNKTSTDPLLKIIGTFKVNPGSTITVNAGGKSAGTYKLISAGTLNDGADLVANSSVENCASGHYGVVTKSGNAINLVIIKGTPPSTGDTVVDPDQPGGGDDTDDPVVIVPTINPDWGYVKTGLGAGGNEVAVVFTNHTETMTWTVSENLENVQFLVVGGGGGGGGKTSGGGGGGGGVIVGSIKNTVLSGSTVEITVGAGGSGGEADKAGATGKPSKLVVDTITYVSAKGGGYGNKRTGNGSSGGSGGGAGGSGTGGAADAGSYNSTYVTATKYASAGGVGTWSLGGGGGGGATEVGDSLTSSSTQNAAGGEGFTSEITGVVGVYGSGGSGGKTNNSLATATPATNAGGGGNSAKANFGGGGAGAGGAGSGGKGGSGIVVLRYTTATVDPEEPVLTAVVAPAAVADLVYTGSELTGVVAADGYTLTSNTATDAGTYEATATLAEGYKWSDDTTEPKTISWSIAKATNEWTTEPSISLESWTQGETAGVLTSGVAKFGEVTSSMTELPTAVGKYTITYTVVETDNYSGLTKEVSFEILKKPTSYDFTVGDVAIADGKLTFKGNFAIDGESEATEMNLVVSVYDVAEGGDALKTVTVEGIPAGEFNQEIDIAALELADGVYYLAFEVQDEAGNVLDKVEERSMLTIGEAKAVKPTVNYASGTKFTAIGVEQKPVVMPADGNGYTVSYEGDFTFAGTHRIVIALKDGWTWSDGTSDSLTYEYEFIERTYTEYYIKPRGGASEGGTFQSDDRWYTDPGFAAGSKMSTCPNVYDAHNIANIPADSQCWLFIDNESDIVLKPKFGKFTVDGNLRIVTYSGALMFQNDTATPMPIWEVESGVSTIDGVVFDVNGSGTGYIDIAANATNVLGGVNYNSGFESSKKLFVRFSDEATAGSALRVHDFDDYYITNFGWFEGGAEGSTYALDIEEGVLSLNNPDAVSGVAGDLAITVKLGDKVGAANAYLNVAGTLNINEGSTLAVDANSMPCGVYTIINAATFNGADLLTSAAGATVTGLAEFTSGELVREGNKIVLYIETTIPPRVPGIEGDSVATNAVFETARVAKPIWYKTMPTINGDEITFNRVTVKVPEYYDVTLETLADGYLVNLKLKDNLKAFIANKVENDQIVTPAIRIENEKVYIHLENTKSDLYYTLLKSTKLGAEAEWKPTEEYAIGKADFEYTPAEGEAETCFFKAGDVMDEPPAK